MSRHQSEVATELNLVQWTMRSRHQKVVATEDKQLTEHLCLDIRSSRDISTESEAVATSVCKETKVATSSAIERRSRHHLNGRDISCTEKKVATRSSCCDINYTERKSRHHSAVATTPSCRDINCKDLRSRHHEAVATTGERKRGCDKIKLSRHLLQRPEGRDNI